MKLTKLFKSGLIALLCMVASQSAQASFTYALGDLLMAFRQDGNTTSTYVVDLGSAASFRDASSAFSVSVPSTIAADLAAAFGADWYTDGTVHASIVGASGSSSTPISGDGTGGAPPYYNKSIYVSMSGTGSAADNSFSLTQSTIANMAGTIGNTFGSSGFAANNGGNQSATIAISSSGDYTEFTPAGGAANYFNGLTSSTEVNPNGTFDLYRILANKNNATDAPSANGVAQYQGAFTLSNTGVISFTPDVSAAPEPSRVLLLGFGLSGLLLRRRRKA